MIFFKRKAADLRSAVSIRLEAIGGQGANTAGKILAEAAVLGMGYTGNHFSSFGSEKRGTPVRSFVRFSIEKKPVRSASFISTPDILVVFNESLIQTHPEILEGASEKTTLILNTPHRPSEIRLPKGLQLGFISLISASSIAFKQGAGLNAVMLGAIANSLPEVDAKTLKKTIDSYFTTRGKSASDLSQLNQKAFEAGHEGAKMFPFFDLSRNKMFETESQAALPEMGWMNAPIGGAIVNPGNSVLKDHSVSRKGVAPLLVKELCFNCGICDMVCPDFCFVWDLTSKSEAPDLKGIDYQYCKGCQKCVAVCPVNALIPTEEEKIPTEARQVKLFPDLEKAELAASWRSVDWPKFVEELSQSEKMMTPLTELLDTSSYLRPDFSQSPVSERLKGKSK